MIRRVPSAAFIAVAISLAPGLACDPALDEHEGICPNCQHRRCPRAVQGWESRWLTVDAMREIQEPWTQELARQIMTDCAASCSVGGCAAAPVGIDARNQLPVYLRLHCDDLCPSYAKFLVTYADDQYGGADCAAIDMCYQLGGADLEIGWCLPFEQYYGGCFTGEQCNWNGSCEPALGETDIDCPGDCICGEPISGPVEYRLAAEVEPVADDSALGPASLCTYGTNPRIRNLLPELAAFYAEVLGTFDATAEAQRSIIEGRFPLLFRLQTVEESLYQVLYLTAAAPLASPPGLDGTDVVPWPKPLAELAPHCASNDPSYLRGWIDDDHLPLPLPGVETVTLTTTGGSLYGTRDATEWRDVRIWAFVASDEANGTLPPAIAAYLNSRIAADPFGPEAASLTAALDGQCDPGICPAETPGVGDCATSNPPDITATEVRCQSRFHALFTDGDPPAQGTPVEQVCYQYRIVRAVPVVVPNL